MLRAFFKSCARAKFLFIRFVFLLAFFTFSAKAYASDEIDRSVLSSEFQKSYCYSFQLVRSYRELQSSYADFKKNLFEYADSKSELFMNLLADFSGEFFLGDEISSEQRKLSMKQYAVSLVLYLDEHWIEKIADLFFISFDKYNLLDSIFNAIKSDDDNFDINDYLGCLNDSARVINDSKLISLYESGGLPVLIAELRGAVRDLEDLNYKLEGLMFGLRHFLEQLRCDSAFLEQFIIELAIGSAESLGPNQLDLASESTKYFAKYINLYWLNSISINLLKFNDTFFLLNNIVDNIAHHLYGSSPRTAKWLNDLAKVSYELHLNVTNQKKLEIQNGSKEYEQAFAMMRKGELVKAATAFEGFIVDFPQNFLLPNAYYWLAEIYYNLDLFEKAYQYSELSWNLNPEGVKKTLSGLKMALSKEQMGDTTKSCGILSELNLADDKIPNYIVKMVSSKLNQLNCLT